MSDNPSVSATVKDEREKYLSMSVEDKRQLYSCGTKFVTLEQVANWSQHIPVDKMDLTSGKQLSVERKYEVDEEMNRCVSLWRGDITCLEIDCIVNAANSSLLGGGGVDGAIHRAAGSSLLNECRMLKGCNVGEAKATCGYKLPAKYVIHTVGPQGENSSKLKDCYSHCFEQMLNLGQKSIAYPCISTGIYGYPNEAAVHVALSTIRKCLGKLKEQKKLNLVDRVIFCLFLDIDVQLYNSWMRHYFPRQADSADSSVHETIKMTSDVEEARDKLEKL